MTTAIIELDHLQKNFGKFAALKDVRFHVWHPVRFWFSRPSGAGKSTTIRVILGLLKKSGGSVTVFGKDAWRDDAGDSSTHRLYSWDVYLWPNLSGGEIIDLFATFKWPPA